MICWHCIQNIRKILCHSTYQEYNADWACVCERECEWVRPFEWKTCEILPHQINWTILAWIGYFIPNTDHRSLFFALERTAHICLCWCDENDENTHTGERERCIFLFIRICIWTLFKTIRSLWIGVENWSIVFSSCPRSLNFTPRFSFFFIFDFSLSLSLYDFRSKR